MLIRPILGFFLRGQPGINGILGNFLSIFGFFYGILLGLLAVASYQNKVVIEDTIVQEATELSSLSRLATAFSGNGGQEVRTVIGVKRTFDRVDKLVGKMHAVFGATSLFEVYDLDKQMAT